MSWHVKIRGCEDASRRPSLHGKGNAVVGLAALSDESLGITKKTGQPVVVPIAFAIHDRGCL